VRPPDDSGPEPAHELSRLPRSIPEEAGYDCDSCGERIVVPIDASAGREQEYVEDCPVCCRANVIRVRVGDDGEAWISARAE